MAFYFPDNTAKPCSYELKISENFEIKHVFQSKSFFHHIKFLHTCCLSAFKDRIQAVQNLMIPTKQVKSEPDSGISLSKRYVTSSPQDFILVFNFFFFYCRQVRYQIFFNISADVIPDSTIFVQQFTIFNQKYILLV